MEIKYFKLAQKLNQDHKSVLLKEQVHFRGSINSMSMVSISDEKSELGLKCDSNKYKSNTDIQKLILQDIDKIKAKPIPKRETPEKKLQSWIINSALNNDHLLPFNNDIKFITSELAIINKKGEKIVTDILGYSESNNQLCVIELKSDRLLKKLIQQVSNFENVIKEEFDFFAELIALYGFLKKEVLSTDVTKIIVWPYNNTSPKKELNEANIVEVTYQGHYTFTNYI